MNSKSPLVLEQYSALEEIYNALDGPYWMHPYMPWVFNGDYSAPCYYGWVGISCICNSVFCYVSELSLDEVNARGTLPSSIQILKNLTLLSFSGNYISGAIPSEIGSLTGLSNLNINFNYFTSIPPQIGQLERLQTLDFGHNYITELISGIGLLGMLTSLTGLDNPLEGTMPSQFRSLVLLNYLELEGEFSGPFPLLAWKSLSQLYLQECYFSSTIPSEIGESTSLSEVTLDYDSFIPDEVYSWLNIPSLNLHSFWGTISSSIGIVTNLESLSIQPIGWYGPSQFSHSLFISCDFITGSLPSEIGQLQNLQDLSIAFSSITGTIPLEIGQLNCLQILVIRNTSITGPIPTEIGKLRSLQELTIDFAKLTGSIPSQIGQLQSLRHLTIADTSLSGAIPSEMSQLLRLTAVYLSNNAIFGSVPMWLLYLENMSRLELSANCFHGELVCHHQNFGKKMHWLGFSMLSSGMSCINYIWTRPSDGSSYQINSAAGFYPMRYMTGSIPSCIWNMLSSYSFIDLSGNGFTGTVPDLPSTINLISLDLSFNQLVGQIPNYTNENFDSDYGPITWANNRLSGTLSSPYIGYVANNRLSGNFPKVIASPFSFGPDSDLEKYLSKIKMHYIGGNLMQFSLSDIGVPNTVQNQMQLMEYNGSQLLNVSIVVVSVFYVVLVIFGVLYLSIRPCQRFDRIKTLEIWLKKSRILISGDFKTVSFTLKLSAVSLIGSALLYLLFKLAPSLSVQYSTHTYQYGWTVSAAFLHGLAPAVVLNLLVCFFAFAFVISSRVSPREKQLYSSASSPTATSSFWICIGIDFILFTCNFVIMFVANAAYLGGALIFSDFLPQGASTSTLYGSAGELLLALVKLVWKGVMFRLSSGAKTLFSLQSKESILFHVFIQTVSFLIIPAICVAIYSQDCFLQLFVDTSDMPFMYSYQCGSALIVKYVPVLFYAYAMSGQLRLVVMLLYMLYSKGQERSFLLWLFNVPRVLSLGRVESRAKFVPTERIVSRLALNTVIGLTFGIAFPYLGFVAIASNVLEVVIWLIALGRYMTLAVSAEESEEAATDILLPEVASDDTDDATIAAQQNDSYCKLLSDESSDIRSTSSGSNMDKDMDKVTVVSEEVRRCVESVRQEMTLVIVLSAFVVFVFWSCISFDMIADVYGMQKGLDAAIIVVVVCPVLVLSSSLVWLHYAEDVPSFCAVFKWFCSFQYSDGSKQDSKIPIYVNNELQSTFLTGNDEESRSESSL